MDDEDKDQLVDVVFRNGSLTAVGIVLSFSLGFLTQWANNPIPWKLTDLPTVLLLATGIILQLKALASLLDASTLKRRLFEKANRVFVYGVTLTATGVFVGIVTDLLRLEPV
jgi:hypothetical protein